MGMYTELCLGVELKQDTPLPIIAAIEQMVSGEVGRPPPGVEHPLFETDRWSWMLRSGGSFYFSAQPSCTWVKKQGSWYLTVLTSIKNYSGEWEALLNFLAPHVADCGFVGYLRYEEDSHPTLLYAHDDEIGGLSDH